MNTRQLKHFLAVLESRSILKAATQLNISQPALSKSISNLEDEYGTSLFERLARGVRPTAFALRFERHARRILADIERSRRAARDIISGASGTVLIGTGPAFVPVVSAAVHDMMSEHPGVDFSIVQGHNAALRSALMANAIDLFVGMISGADDSGEFKTRQLVSDKIVCVCRKNHQLLQSSPVATDLLEYGWVLPEEGETGRAMLEAFFRNRNLPALQVKIMTNSDRVARYFLQRTDLIGLMPETVVDHDEYHDIAAVPISDLSFSRDVGIISRQEQHFSQAVELFEAYLERRFSVRECSY